MPSGSAAAAPESRTPQPLAWRVWPLLDDWKSATCGILLPIGGAAIVGLTSGHAGPAVFTAIVLFATASKIYFPIHFELNALGISERGVMRRSRIPWQRVHFAKFCENGIFLAPVRSPGHWTMFRGMFISTGAHHQAAIESILYYLHRRRERDDFSYRTSSIDRP